MKEKLIVEVWTAIFFFFQITTHIIQLQTNTSFDFYDGSDSY